MSGIQTRDILPELKDRSFLQYIQQEIIAIVERGPSTLFRLLKELDNCDPLVAKKAVDNLKALKLIHFDAHAKEYYCKPSLVPTSPRHRTDLPFMKFANRVPLTSSASDSCHSGSLAKEIKKCLPEASPVFFQWWFYDSAYSLLSSAVLSRVNCSSRVAFMGAPTLGAYFSRVCSNPISIFDIDKHALEAMRNHVGKKTEFVQYDVFDEIGESFRNKFHLVYLDPPWYLGIMLLFLKRAMEISKNDGYIFISLPALNTRATALMERNRILQFVTDFGLEIISYWPSKIEYEIPKFERNTYAHSGIALDSPWRRGNLLLLKKQKQSAYIHSTLIPCQQESWREFDIGKCRFFLREEDDYENTNPVISKVPSYDSFYLNTTSAREPGRRKANMISSRNHGALLEGRRILYEIFEELSSRAQVEDTREQLVRRYDHRKEHIENTVNTILCFLRE